MTTPSIAFFSFDEAVKLAEIDRSSKFIGLVFVAPFTWLNTYILRVYPRDTCASLQREKSEIFDIWMKDEFYALDEVPAEAKEIFYVRNSDLPNSRDFIRGVVGVEMLHYAVPGLAEAQTYDSKEAFIEAASAQFATTWPTINSDSSLDVHLFNKYEAKVTNIYKYKSSAIAFEKAQNSEGVMFGDTLVVEKEGVVGVACKYTFAVTAAKGKFYEFCWDAPLFDPTKLLTAVNCIRAAVAEAERLGFAIHPDFAGYSPNQP